MSGVLASDWLIPPKPGQIAIISFDQSLARNTDSEVAKSGSTADLDNTFFILIEFFFFCVSCVRSTFHDASTNK